MKKYLIILILCVCGISAHANTFVQEGTNFRVENSLSKDTPTIYTYTDKDGQVYQIIRSKTGSYYILKVSKKTGKEYKYYLPKEIQEQLKRLPG